MAGRADAQGTGNYVDFQEYVDFQLRKTRDQIRTTDLLTGATVAAVLVLGYLLLFIVADQWLFPRGVPVAIRWIGLLAWGAAVGGWVALRLGLPLSRKVSGLFAAKQVEQAEPELRSNLLNWVDLQRAGRPVDPTVLRAIERQAAVQLSKMDVTDAVDHRPLLRSGYLLLGVVLFGCLYAVLSPKPLGPTLARVIPFTDVAPPTRTVIRDVQPGDARVLARTPLAITVDLAGVIPERVELRYTTADRKFRDEPLPLQPEGTAGTRFRGILSGESGQGLLQDLSYHIVAGDALSPTYRVTVDQPPSATIRELRITPPPYTGQTPETLSGGNFEALEGSTIELAAEVPIPVQSAVIEFLDEAQGKPNGEQEPVTVTDGTKLTAKWTLERRRDGTYAPFYRVQCRTEDGRTDPAPIVYQLKINPDQPPTIALIAPERDLDLPANAVVPLLAEAADPDFELGPINLVVQRKGKVIARETLSQGKQKAIRVQHDLSLKPLALEPGDEISFFLTAQDNRQPERNLAQTPPLKIRILAPASDAAVQQQLAEEKTRQQDQLAQLDQPTGEGRDLEPGTENPAEMDPANDAPSATETEPNPGDDPMTDPPREGSTEGTAGTEGSGTAGGQGDSNQGEPNSGDATGQSTGNGRNQKGNGPTESKPLSANGEDDQEALERILERNRAMNEGNRGTAGGQGGAANPKTNPPSQPSPTDTPQQPPQPTEGTTPAPMPNDPSGASPDNANGAGDAGTSPPKTGSKAPRPGTNTPDPSANPSPAEPSAEPMPQDPAHPKPAANNTPKGTNGPTNSRGTPQDPAANPAEMPSDPAADPMASPDQPASEAGNSPKGSQPATTPDKNGPKPPPGTPAGNDAGTEPGEMPEGTPSTPGEPPGQAPQPPTNSKRPMKPGDAGAKPATPGANENPGASPAEPMTNDDQSGNNPSAPNGEAPQSPTDKPGTKGQPGPGNKDPGKAPNNTPQPSGDEPQGPGEPSSDQAMEPQDGQPPGRDGSPNAGETTPPGPGRSKGQRSEQPQTGEKGSSAQSSEGQPGSGESGPGDTTQQPGNRSQGSSNSGKNGAGSKPSQGAGKPSKGGGQSGSEGSASDSAASDSANGQPGSSSPSGKPGNKGGSPSGGDSVSASQDDAGMPEDPANPGKGDATPGKSPKAPMNGAPNGEGTAPAEGDESSAENGTPKSPAGTPKGPGKNAPGKTDQGAEPMTGEGAEGPGQADSAPMGPSPDKGPGDKPGEGNSSPEQGGGSSPKSPQDQSPAKPEGDGQEGNPWGQKGGGEQSGKEGGGKPSSGSGKPSQGGKEGGGKGGGESGGQAPGQGGQPAAGGPPGAPSSSSGGGGVGGPAGNPGAAPGAGLGQEGQETTPVEPPTAGDPANLDYNKQATELVLQRLQQNLERGEVDPKLLEELGWTEEQLQRFVGRLQTALEETAKPAETPQDQARRVQFEEMLKSLDVHRAGSVRTGGDQPSREVEQTDVRRAPVPAEYRRAWENYTRSLSKTPKPKP
jgi:hypothetical protein